MCMAAFSPAMALAKGKLKPMTAIAPGLSLLLQARKKKEKIAGTTVPGNDNYGAGTDYRSGVVNQQRTPGYLTPGSY